MIGPEKAEIILKQGGYLERRDERKTPKRCIRLMTRLYDSQGNEIGVANYARRRLNAMLKIVEIKGPNNEQRWIWKSGRIG